MPSEKIIPLKCLNLDFRTDGIAALWTGLAPNMARNAIINAAELASYDQIKQVMIGSGIFQDNVITHLGAGPKHCCVVYLIVFLGLGAGFFAVCFGSPVDVVKSRIMGRF